MSFFNIYQINYNVLGTSNCVRYVKVVSR